MASDTVFSDESCHGGVGVFDEKRVVADAEADDDVEAGLLSIE